MSKHLFARGLLTTILAYVRDGHGIGLVREAVLADPQGLVVRYLDPDHFPPIAAKLICRKLPGTGEQLDLSPEAQSWREVLTRVAVPRLVIGDKPLLFDLGTERKNRANFEREGGATLASWRAHRPQFSPPPPLLISPLRPGA